MTPSALFLHRLGLLLYMSKLSFQYGFKVFLMTDVVRVCSPEMVATAKGSGKPKLRSVPLQGSSSRSIPRTEDIAFVEAVGGNDCTQ